LVYKYYKIMNMIRTGKRGESVGNGKWRRHKDALGFILFIGLYCAVTWVLHIPCPILWCTGVSCPGCGITRAALALCRLDVGAALYYNPSVFIVGAAAILLILLRKQKKASRWIIYSAAVLMLAVYIYRMAVLHSPMLQFAPQNGIIPRIFRWICNNFTGR